MNMPLMNQHSVLLKAILWMSVVTTFLACGNKPRYEGPLSPEESRATFRFDSSLRVDIFAVLGVLTLLNVGRLL